MEITIEDILTDKNIAAASMATVIFFEIVNIFPLLMKEKSNTGNNKISTIRNRPKNTDNRSESVSILSYFYLLDEERIVLSFIISKIIRQV